MAYGASDKIEGQATFTWGIAKHCAGCEVVTQVWRGDRWSTSQRRKTEASGRFVIELTFGKYAPGTYRWRVGVTSLGRTTYSSIWTLRRTPRITFATAGHKPLGQLTYGWGRLASCAGAPAWTEVLIGQRWSRSQIRASAADGSYAIPLTYGASAPGTYRWRVKASCAGRVYVSKEAILERVATPLKQTWERLSAQLSGTSGIAFTPVGRGSGPVTTLGGEQLAASYSMGKVPTSIAALRHRWTSATQSNVVRAIRFSSNSALAALVNSFGNRRLAQAKIQGVIEEYGSDSVRWLNTHPGNIMWTNGQAARFAAGLACGKDRASQFVVTQMANITPQHRWGLGQIPGSTFKGGWMPSRGGYVLRQLGMIKRSNGHLTGVAITVHATSYAAGTQDFNRIAAWIQRSLGQLPGGRCS